MVTTDKNTGSTGIEYRGEYAWDSILQDICRQFGNGMRQLAEVMCDSAEGVINADAALRMLEKLERERGDR